MTILTSVRILRHVDRDGAATAGTLTVTAAPDGYAWACVCGHRGAVLGPMPLRSLVVASLARRHDHRAPRPPDLPFRADDALADTLPP